MNELTRYRVIGAVFLVAIAIIVLPMVFDGEGVRVKQLPELSQPLPPVPTDAELDSLQIAPDEVAMHADEVDATSGLVDRDGYLPGTGTRIGDPALLTPTDPTPEAIAPGASRDTAAAVSESAVTADTPQPTPEPAPAAAPAAGTDVASKSGAGQAPKVVQRRAPPARSDASKSASKPLAKRPIWAVQLASFSTAANARALRDRLLKDGYEAWTSTARQNSAVRTRVAIGPLLDRGDAERMRDLVSGKYQVSAIVVHMEP